MTRLLLKILAVFCLVIFQIAVMTKLMIWGTIPNLIILLAIAMVFRGRFQDGILLAGIGGLLLDLASPIRFGAYTMLFLAAIGVINFYVLKIFPTPSLMVSFLIFAASILLIDVAFFLLLGNIPYWQLIPQAIFGGLWGIVIYWLVEKFIKPKEEIKLT